MCLALKVPKLDGYNGVFCQKYWGIVEETFIKVVLGFFHGEYLLKELNITNIVLTPKVKKPEEVSQFRLITCHSFAYKIISKSYD